MHLAHNIHSIACCTVKQVYQCCVMYKFMSFVVMSSNDVTYITCILGQILLAPFIPVW